MKAVGPVGKAGTHEKVAVQVFTDLFVARMMSATMTRQSRTATHVEMALRALREASVTMLAAIATLLCALAIAPGAGPAVLAVVLCLALSRSQLDRNLRGRIEAAVALPVVGVLAVGVGTLLHQLPWLGALVFVCGMFASIWLRRFGPMARRAGSLIALIGVLVFRPQGFFGETDRVRA